jgi:hypothetical protein
MAVMQGPWMDVRWIGDIRRASVETGNDHALACLNGMVNYALAANHAWKAHRLCTVCSCISQSEPPAHRELVQEGAAQEHRGAGPDQAGQLCSSRSSGNSHYLAEACRSHHCCIPQHRVR